MRTLRTLVPVPIDAVAKDTTLDTVRPLAMEALRKISERDSAVLVGELHESWVTYDNIEALVPGLLADFDEPTLFGFYVAEHDTADLSAENS